jgi:hypothetical protein
MASIAAKVALVLSVVGVSYLYQPGAAQSHSRSFFKSYGPFADAAFCEPNARALYARASVFILPRNAAPSTIEIREQRMFPSTDPDRLICTASVA